MAELLRKEPDTQVEVVNGGRGEFTVSVDGRALDPVALERARMAQMCAAVVPEPETVPDGLSYVAYSTSVVVDLPTGKATAVGWFAP